MRKMKQRLPVWVIVCAMLIGMIPIKIVAAVNGTLQVKDSENVFCMETEKSTVKKGEEFSVTILLNKTIPVSADVSNVQGNINFDSDVVTYVSHELSEGYRDYESGYNASKKRIQFSKTDMSAKAFEVPAGKVITVTFKAKKEITEDQVKTRIHLESKIYVSKGTYTVKDFYKDILITNVVENPFEDVSEDVYYCNPVLWAVEEGITNGVSSTRFGVNQPCTREQVVTFLWRSVGKPEASKKTCEFTDVGKTDFYYKAVLWAVEEGITNGVSSTKFGVGQPCTREQVVTFLWRTAGKSEVSNTKCTFTDVGKTDFYYEAVLWAVEKGITKGVSATRFGVGEECTREQVVTFLYRYNNLKK